MGLTCYCAKTCSCMMHTRQLWRQSIICVSTAQVYEREVTCRKIQKGLRLSQRLQHRAEISWVLYATHSRQKPSHSGDASAPQQLLYFSFLSSPGILFFFFVWQEIPCKQAANPSLSCLWQTPQAGISGTIFSLRRMAQHV